MKGKKALDALCVCIVLLTLLGCASVFVLADPAVPGNALPTPVSPVSKIPDTPGIPHIFPSPTVTPSLTPTPAAKAAEEPTVFYSHTPFAFLLVSLIGGIVLVAGSAGNKDKK
ncbi:MAG TPA: hypothetical protein VGK13_06490 [Methanocellaceae archaeon]